MLADVEVPIVIVGFGNADDIVKCLGAVALQRRCPNFGVFICENGGPRAFEALVEALAESGGPCPTGLLISGAPAGCASAPGRRRSL